MLAFMSLPKERGGGGCAQTDPLKRVDGEIKRRTEVVGIIPDEGATPAWSARSCCGPDDRRPCTAPHYMTLEARRRRCAMIWLMLPATAAL